MPMASNWAPEATPNPPTSPPRRTRLAPSGAWAILMIALLLGGYFRTVALFSWDDPSFRLHPDERFFIGVASAIRVPSSFDEYLDSSRNPLNPRNYPGSTFYVYGLLPQTLTRLTAVMLTPNAALPPTIPDPQVKDQNAAQQVLNPELAVPKLSLLQPLLNPHRVDLTNYYQIHKVGRAYS